MTAVSLVSMPWHMVRSPSIQVGTLHAVLDAAGVRCRSHSFHLAFQDFLLDQPPKRGRLAPAEFEAVGVEWGNLGIGEWLFALDELRADSRTKEERYLDFLRRSGIGGALLSRLRRVREVVPRFLERCADEVLAAEPDVVGFTCTYWQTWPSAALAHVLKRRAPDLRTVLGGASCEGPMGPALLEAFPWIDAAARGEGEGRVVALVEALASGEGLEAVPGLVFRRAGEVVESSAPGPAVDMDDVPVPDYHEFFERLARSAHLATAVTPQVPFETSRGCWWGEKNHCTFCGLNGLAMTSRKRSPESAHRTLTTLARRHSALDFTAVDNILPLEYFDTFLPRLAREGSDLGLFYESKANLTRERVALLRAAGVRTLQPGLESLSTPVLRLMDKGVSALQNVRLLKWCLEEDMHVIWNLLYGFPGETAEHYEAMAELVPSLVHLEPPSLVELGVYRFSPYFERSGDHGLRIDGPLPFYGMLYDVEGDSLHDLAHSFAYSHADGRRPDAFVGRLRDEIERWRDDWERNRGALTYRRGPGFLTITDTRTTTAAGHGALRYELGRAESIVYQACEGGAGLRRIEAALAAVGESLERRELTALLDDLVRARLMMRDGDRWLALALANH